MNCGLIADTWGQGCTLLPMLIACIGVNLVQSYIKIKTVGKF